MSDFKFNCPDCGQKIACDTGYAGAQITCPACQKTLTVPAPSPGATAAPVAATAAAAAAAPASSTTTANLPPRAPASPPARPQPGQRPLPQVPGALAKPKPEVEAGIDTGWSYLAMASLICSVVFAIGCIPGIICGHMAKAKMRRNPLLDGSGMATAGLVISYITLFFVLATSAGFAMFLKSRQPIQVVREMPDAVAKLQPRIVDEVKPGDRPSENAHSLAMRNSSTGLWEEKRWRDALNGGFIRYTMQVLPDHAMSLNCRYWGNDSNRRLFDIVVDDQIIGTQKIDYNVPGHFFDVEYKIPTSLTRGKTNVVVELAAHQGMTAGGVFDIETLKR